MKRLILTAFAAALVLAAPAAIAAPNDNNNKPAAHRPAKPAKPAAKKPNRTVTHRTVVNRNRNNGNVTRRTTTRTTNGNRTNVRVNVTRVNRQAPRRVRSVNVYVRPAGWYQKRWTYGQRLPRAWFAANYYVSDFVTLGLTAPPAGYQWVRVGNDVVLVDLGTGEIVQTDYDAYY